MELDKSVGRMARRRPCCSFVTRTVSASRSRSPRVQPVADRLMDEPVAPSSSSNDTTTTLTAWHPHQTQRDLRGDPSVPSEPTRLFRSYRWSSFFRVGPQAHHASVGEHHHQRLHIVAGDAVLDRTHAAGVVGHHPADGRHVGGARRRRKEEPQAARARRSGRRRRCRLHHHLRSASRISRISFMRYMASDDPPRTGIGLPSRLSSRRSTARRAGRARSHSAGCRRPPR